MAGPKAEAQEQEVEEKRRRFNRYMSRHGLKSTRQRHTVAEVFFGTTSHLTIEDVLELVRKRDPRIGYATVYRTLKLLNEAGLADERHFGDGLARYEQADGSEHHDHMICTRCQKVIEFVDDEIERLQEAAAKRYNFRINRHRLELYGVCAECRKKAAD